MTGQDRKNKKKNTGKPEKKIIKKYEKEVWKAGNMIYPLPAVLVSVGDSSGRKNAFTVAWTGTVCTNPAMVYISVRPERYSYGMIKETGEFVINLTTRSLAAAADFCGVRSGRDMDKLAMCSLTCAPSRELSYAPLIEQSPVNIECRVTQVQELGSHHMFLAEVMCVHVSSGLLDEKGRLALEKAGLIAYSHGMYTGLGETLGQFGWSVKKEPSPKKERLRKNKAVCPDKVKKSDGKNRRSLRK